MNENFSIFKKIHDTVPCGTVNMENVQTIVTSNGMKKWIETVRMEVNCQKRQELKKQLPNITVNGIFSQRGNKFMTEYSGITCIDFDHVPSSQFQNLREQLEKQSTTLMLFTSPSGDGLKLFLRHDLSDPGLHWNLYGQLIRKFMNEFGCPYVDTCTKDISRATYLSYDPACYYNPNAVAFHFVLDPTIQQQTSGNGTGISRQPVSGRNYAMTNSMIEKNKTYQQIWTDKQLMEYIDRHQWSKFMEDYQEGHRNDSILIKAGQLFRCGVDFYTACEKLVRLYSQVFSDMLAAEVEYKVEYIYRISPEDTFGTERQKWIDKRNSGIAAHKKVISPFE